ncbi:MAG: hypothetical protein U5K37_10200 [Natrialbaceae archaeon]|nr:hypothetical protein [Natrialbaceae archaeon]
MPRPVRRGGGPRSKCREGLVVESTDKDRRQPVVILETGEGTGSSGVGFHLEQEPGARGYRVRTRSQRRNP